ncbi:MAG: hypothetical protein KatS3mg104_1577 [Phycisphaerae bacterium]|nr:MAG: hypothetical protein KatS3mg104_1577 [Phycisphaerae bacterium]
MSQIQRTSLQRRALGIDRSARVRNRSDSVQQGSDLAVHQQIINLPERRLRKLVSPSISVVNNSRSSLVNPARSAFRGTGSSLVKSRS